MERSAEDRPGAFLFGNPPGWVRALDRPPIEYGGMFNTELRYFTGEPSQNPTVWVCGEEQLELILFGDDNDCSRLVCKGSAGSGKTAAGMRWALKRALFNGVDGGLGVVAPVTPRLRVLWLECMRSAPPHWFKNIRVAEREIELVNGCRMQFLAAKEHSAQTGSPAQGFTFGAGILVDEEQDIADLADITMRGRNPAGKSYVLSTCTLKRDPAWRSRMDMYKEQTATKLHTMHIHSSPFVSQEYLEDLKHRLSPDQYRMLVLAEEAPPESAVYLEFDRETHIQPVPLLGGHDLTEAITGKPYLIGHDPGNVRDVSEIIKAYELPGTDYISWWVIGELTTETTTEGHVTKLAEYMRQRFKVSPKGCKVVADPYGYAAQGKPDVSVYKLFVKGGFEIRPAAYSVNKTAPVKPGKVPKDEGIEMVRMLFRNAAGVTRLFIGCDDLRRPVAPKLVAALETEERNAAGEAEANKRRKQHDHSDWPAALRYGLWPWERVRLSRRAWDKRSE